MFGIDTSGVFPIAPTPFTPAGEIDVDSTDRMIDWYKAIGATGVTILGIMGEATKLSAEESRVFVQQVLKRVSGRVPVVVHILTPGFKPVQVTQDLGGFWREHYPKLKSELQRRYPKHEWR